jgi:hypothetical protein
VGAEQHKDPRSLQASALDANMATKCTNTVYSSLKNNSEILIIMLETVL